MAAAKKALPKGFVPFGKKPKEGSPAEERMESRKAESKEPKANLPAWLKANKKKK